jgi:hypothetical protein
MTTSERDAIGETGGTLAGSSASVARPRLRQFPGLVAISIYMALLAGVIAYSVAIRRVDPLYIVFSVLFIVGSVGLMLFRRWGWALTLGAAVLMSGVNLWSFSRQHEYITLVQGLLDLVFFLYLVRGDVREKMR